MHGCTETLFLFQTTTATTSFYRHVHKHCSFLLRLYRSPCSAPPPLKAKPHRGGLTGFLVQYIEHYDSPSVLNQAQRVCSSCKSSIFTVSHDCGLKVSLLPLLKASCVQPCAACLLIQHFDGVTWTEGLVNCCNSLYSTVFSANLNILSCQSQHRRWP